MPSNAEIAIVLTATAAQAERQLAAAQKMLASLGVTATRTQQQHKRAFDLIGRDTTTLHKGMEVVQRRAETMFRTFRDGQLGLNLVSLGLGGVGMAAIGVGMAFNSTQQQAELAFGVLLKGPGEAAAAIAGLNDLVGKIPFTLTPIMQAGQRLVAAGWKDVPGLITTIADAISATGDISNDKLQSVVSSFVGLKSSGVFSMGVISDLTSAGIPIIRALAQQMGMTEYATTKMLEGMSGKVPSDFIVPKIIDALKGLTGGLAAQEMKTLAGSIVALQDNFGKFMASLTGGVTDAAQGAISGLADMFDNLRGSMEGWDPTIKKTLGFALLLGSAVAGVGGIGGAVPGLGALGSLFGGGGGMAGPILAVVITLVALIALLTPWGAIFGAIKSGIDAIKDAIDRLPHGGGGGGGGGAAGPVTVPIVWGPLPAVPSPPPLAVGLDLRMPPLPDVQGLLDRLGALTKDVVLRLPTMTDLQALLDKTADLRKNLLLQIPGVEFFQRAIDAWPALWKGLTLMPTAPDTIQKILDGWPTLWKALSLTPTGPDTVQKTIDTWPDFTHALGVVLPGYEVEQHEIDQWSGFMHAMGLMLPVPDDLQKSIDAYPDFIHKLGLELPTPDQPQGWINLWPDFTHLLNLSLTRPGDLQQLVNLWPNFTHSLNFQIPSGDQLQSALNTAYQGIKINVGLNITNPPPGIPQLPGLPGGVSVIPPGLGASGGQIGGVTYPPGSLPKFAEGGVVPGPIGSPMLAVIHGGEEITSVGGRAGGGLTVNVTVNGPMLGTDLEDVIVQQIDNARRRARLPQGV